MWTDSIEKPTLILDPKICRANIQRMAERAERCKVKFRPHCKTHQSAVISEWFREVGVDAITVSSVEMASYFADVGGWRDITIAFTVNIRQIQEINRLASIAQLGLIVESVDMVRLLQEKLGHPVKLWLDVDTGYHRTGIDWEASTEILDLARTVQSSSKTILAGLLTHPGHTYKATTLAEVESSKSLVHRPFFFVALWCAELTMYCMQCVTFTRSSPGDSATYEFGSRRSR